MTSFFQINTSIEDGYYLIDGQIVVGGDLPSDIFVYENTGTTELGTYYGVCSINEFTSLALYDGTVKPIFGNRFLKHNQVKIKVDLQEDLASVIATLKKNVEIFSIKFRQSSTTTTTFTI